MPKIKNEKVETVVFPSSNYTAVIDDIDIVTTDVGVSIMRITYAMKHPDVKEDFVFIETIANDIANLRSKEFFAFLKDVGFDCSDCMSWFGLVFKTDIAHECYNETLFPVLVNRRFVSHPLIEDNETNLSNKEN